MAAGSILKEVGLRVEDFTVKANEDIERGEIIYNDGNGVLAATTAVRGYIVALEAHDYSEVSAHVIKGLIKGAVEVQKISGQTIKDGQLVVIGATAGEVQVRASEDFDCVVGQCIADAATTATTVQIEKWG